MFFDVQYNALDIFLRGYSPRYYATTLGDGGEQTEETVRRFHRTPEKGASAEGVTRVMFGIPKHENSRDLTRFFSSSIISSLFSGHKGGEAPSLRFEIPDLAFATTHGQVKALEPGAA